MTIRNVDGGFGHALVEVQIAVGANASVALVSLNGREAVGDAKRNKGEPHDPDIAADLAVGRALVALGELLVGAALAKTTPESEPEPSLVGDHVRVTYHDWEGIWPVERRYGHDAFYPHSVEVRHPERGRGLFQVGQFEEV